MIHEYTYRLPILQQNLDHGKGVDWGNGKQGEKDGGSKKGNMRNNGKTTRVSFFRHINFSYFPPLLQDLNRKIFYMSPKGNLRVRRAKK